MQAVLSEQPLLRSVLKGEVAWHRIQKIAATTEVAPDTKGTLSFPSRLSGMRYVEKKSRVHYMKRASPGVFSLVARIERWSK